MKEIKLRGGKPFRGVLRIAVRKPWKLRSRLENALYNRCVGSDEWLLSFLEPQPLEASDIRSE